MKLFLLLCACAALTAASTLRDPDEASSAEAGRPRERRFLASVVSLFHHAVSAVKDEAQTAAHAVSGAAQTAAHAVSGAAQTAAHAVADAANTAVEKLQSAGSTAIDGIQDAAHSVGDALSSAANTISAYASTATTILGPILDQLAATAGPIAKDILNQALQKLKEEAPQILISLGEAGLQELATTVLTSAAGKRDLTSDLTALQEIFAHTVQQQVNSTVQDVHRVVEAVDKFNYALKAHVTKLEKELRSGQDVQTVVRHFLSSVTAAGQPLVDSNAFAMDLSRFDTIVPDAIQHFHQDLAGILTRRQHKRFLLNQAEAIMTLLENGHQQLATLMSHLQSLAQGLLTPTVDNVKGLAETLLNSASGMTSQLLTEALRLLAPFHAQLGPLNQQLNMLAEDRGLPHVFD